MDTTSKPGMQRFEVSFVVEDDRKKEYTILGHVVANIAAGWRFRPAELNIDVGANGRESENSRSTAIVRHVTILDDLGGSGLVIGKLTVADPRVIQCTLNRASRVSADSVATPFHFKERYELTVTIKPTHNALLWVRVYSNNDSQSHVATLPIHVSSPPQPFELHPRQLICFSGTKEKVIVRSVILRSMSGEFPAELEVDETTVPEGVSVSMSNGFEPAERLIEVRMKANSPMKFRLRFSGNGTAIAELPVKWTRAPE